MTPEQYQKQWSVLTGRSEREVYVPEALRPFELAEGARVRLEAEVGVRGTVLEVSSTGLARVRWDDGPISHERVDENGVAL